MVVAVVVVGGAVAGGRSPADTRGAREAAPGAASPAQLTLRPQPRGHPVPQPGAEGHAVMAQPALCTRVVPARVPSGAAGEPQSRGWDVTVGAGVEPQAERGAAAVQGAALRRAVGAAHLRAARAAAPGRVVRAGETVELQEQSQGKTY